MSNTTYSKLWSETQDEISDILLNEIPVTTADISRANKAILYQNICTVYVRYIQLVRQLDVCYDQIVHPQKRKLLRKALDSSMGRMLELHDDMVRLKKTECHFFDDILTDLKLSVEDMEITIPKYILFERTLELQERERNFDEILERMGLLFPNVSESVHSLSLWDVAMLIQTHERGRVGRLRIRTKLQFKKSENEKKTKGQDLSNDLAAIIIQKNWRGYLARNFTKKMREDELLFCGMIPVTKSTEEMVRPHQMVQLVEAHRRAIQERYQYEYEDAIVRIRDRMLDVEAGEMQEAMQDKIRKWFHFVMTVNGEFPDYPNEEEGGSNLILEDKLPPEEVARRANEALQPKEDSSLGDMQDVEEIIYLVQESKFVSILAEENEEYEAVWKNRDESENPTQRHDEQIIIVEKRRELREEIREIVDNLMQIELERLKDALARERQIKRPKTKAPKKKTQTKSKSRKKEKDLTSDRTLDSLYEELIVNGIIKKFPKVSMTDYLGDYNYLGSYMQQNEEWEIPHSLADVRRLLTQYCILPLGSPAVHERAPMVSSVLLVGSSGSGKTMLANIVCSEAGVTLFDLSAKNLVDKYPNKDGLKMLMHLVKKVGALLQPSVILIENAEKMYLKKLSKEDKALDPKRLKPVLSKFLKSIFENERIMLIGTSRDPSLSDIKFLGRTYDKIIMIPKPDYASRGLFWKSFIRSNMGYNLDNIDISLLSKLSDGYTAGSILKACQTVLTDFRKALHTNEPIHTKEFVTALSKSDPIYKEEEDTIRAWYYTTPLGAQLLLAMESDDEIV